VIPRRPDACIARRPGIATPVCVRKLPLIGYEVAPLVRNHAHATSISK